MADADVSQPIQQEVPELPDAANMPPGITEDAQVNDQPDSDDNPSTTSPEPQSITDPRLPEISGLASSLLGRSRLWAINDSGQPAELFAIDHNGQVEDVFSVTVPHRDWESLTSFEINGLSMLLLSDTGDNLGIFGQYQLHVLAEPDTPSTQLPSLTPLNTMTFQYPDGAHNSEAVAVDEVNQQIVLVTKTQNIRHVYTLPLTLTPQSEIQTAYYEGPLASIPRSALDNIALALTGIDLSVVTELEIDRYGNAWALTYRGVYLWTKADEESWGAAFARPPTLITRHSLRQAEAMALIEGSAELVITSEKLPAPLQTIDISSHLN